MRKSLYSLVYESLISGNVCSWLRPSMEVSHACVCCARVHLASCCHHPDPDYSGLGVRAASGLGRAADVIGPGVSRSLGRSACQLNNKPGMPFQKPGMLVQETKVDLGQVASAMTEIRNPH